jgi:signal transduction histidine kinase
MRSLALKLTLAFLAVGLAGIALVALLAGRVTATEFGQFVAAENQQALAAQLAAYYRTNGSWTGVENLLHGEMMGGGGMMGGGHGMLGGGGFVLVDASGRVVAGTGIAAGMEVDSADLSAGTPIVVDGRQAGTLLVRRGTSGMMEQMMTPAANEFLSRVNRMLWLGVLGAAVVALLLGILLARTLTRPLHELTAATQAVAAGDLGRQVQVRSHDELGTLAASFNHMSADLARARDTRRQMTADIAHELRTPLSVILGHAEALEDGVLPAAPETFHLIHDEAQRLNRLVDDLRTLSLAEAGELALVRRPVAPGELLERAAAAFGPRARQKDIALETEITRGLPAVSADPDRLAQVLDNLLDNALRYTPEGGRITLAAAPAPGGVRLAVRDTGPGVAPDDLPHLFDRFYRGDKARQHAEGGSGLGLAIAKSLVEAHRGRITANSERGRGTEFVIDLPRGDEDVKT